ncbi:flavin-containing monooxygenase [Mycolicibacterium litorale]|uniref:flavin-containing monooxygenase n=1 Tax=Mycolicibacterium litorale TaxID=758802 RepID=UPI003CEC4191
MIIGAGLSGLAVGIALRDAGFKNFIIVERASEIGGTWRDNSYPGIAVDVPAQTYQFSFALKPDWSCMFAKGEEVRAYIDEVADRFALWPFIRTSSNVTARHWNAALSRWELTINGEVLTARYVISATGPYVDPKDPKIPGIKNFRGEIMRSQTWNHNYDFTGRRVAVIGTGASAVQFIPILAEKAAEMHVYQRTPIWVVPKLDPQTPEFVKALFRRAPVVQDAVRRGLTNISENLLTAAVQRWHRPRTRRIVRVLTWLLREVFYRRQVPDAALRRRLTPDYGLGCKRPALSSRYLRTFMRPNVELVTDGIDRIVANGIRARDGRVREVDVIVLATGFALAHDAETYANHPVRGRDGFDLERFYRDEPARSYEGISMPGLPNHFMVLAPYGGTGGSWHGVPEAAGIHIVRVLTEARRRGCVVVEPREEAAERWSAVMRERLDGSLLKRNSCETSGAFWVDKNGHIPFLRATSQAEAFHDHADFPLDDYQYSVNLESQVVNQ